MRDVDHPYWSAAFLVAAAFLVRAGLEPWLAERSPLLLFTVAIVIAAGRYGFGPGLLATLLSLVSGTAAFIMDGDSLSMSVDQWTNFGVFVVTSAAMLVFAAHLKASKERSIRLQADLQQAHTESAMGAMAATLAHELNQPLAAASNYLAACRRMAAELEVKPRPKLLTGLSEAESQVRRAGEIIRHARDLVTRKAATREPASLRALIARVIDPLRAGGTCEEARLRIRVEPDADDLLVNAVQIEQVLMNLLRNACQAADSDRPSEIRITARVSDSFTQVEVRDFGPGIAEERLASLFSAERASTSGGLGLGLSISRAIIEAHGGRIWARNNEGGGASFFFTVPRPTEPAYPSSSTKPISSAATSAPASTGLRK